MVKLGIKTFFGATCRPHSGFKPSTFAETAAHRQAVVPHSVGFSPHAVSDKPPSPSDRDAAGVFAAKSRQPCDLGLSALGSLALATFDSRSLSRPRSIRSRFGVREESNAWKTSECPAWGSDDAATASSEGKDARMFCLACRPLIAPGPENFHGPG